MRKDSPIIVIPDWTSSTKKRSKGDVIYIILVKYLQQIEEFKLQLNKYDSGFQYKGRRL